MSLAPTTEVNRSIIDIENTQRMCEALMKTTHYAKLGKEGIFAIVSKAKSLGMDQMDALNGGLYYVQGKVGMPAETMSALIRQKGHSIVKDPKSNDQICILHGKRGDNGDTWTISFSMEDAKRAQLVKNMATSMYEKYPAAMLYNRAMSFLARQLFSDVIKGAGYTFDELKEIADSNSNGQSSTQLVSTIDSNSISDENVELPTIPTTISKDQAEELAKILIGCSPDYQGNFWKFLKTQIKGLERLEEIPIAMYDRIKMGAKIQNEKYQRDLIEGEELAING